MTEEAKATPRPTDIVLHRKSRELEVAFDSGERFRMGAEYLRVHSPSAEVRGHGRGQEILQVGKENVGIRNVEPVGSYAVRLVFDDGHDSGIYSWSQLYRLGREHDENWARYLQRLAEAGVQRHRQAGD
ncbi:MAG: DUF971 domain-containing protein [Gammaproteobacteria bacterium]|jgi:DUF971 family protein